MKYLDYKLALENIAKTNNIEGPAISTIIASLSYALYNNEVINLNLLKETNLLTSTVLNSIITHAASRGYSVFRGQNIIYTITGLNPVQNTSVKKFDLFFEIDGYELRYNQNYEFIRDLNPNSLGTTIDVILCKKNGYRGLTKRSNKYSTFIAQSNISQSIVILNVDNEPYILYNSYEDYLKDNKNKNKLIITTGPSYSIMINNPNKTEDDLYMIRYLEYCDFVNLNLEDIDKEIKEFDVLKNFKIDSNNTFIARENDIDLLKYKIQNNYKSGFIVKSNDDLEYITKEYFKGTIIGLNIIKNSSGIRIYYKTKNGLDISTELINKFKDYLKTAYYIYDTIAIENTDFRAYDLIIKVYYKDNISIAIKYLTNVLDSYENKIGLKFNPYFLLGDLNNSDYISAIDSSSLNTATIQLLRNEYLKFNKDITYINDKYKIIKE